MCILSGYANRILELMMNLVNVDINGAPVKDTMRPVIDKVFSVHAENHIKSEFLPTRYFLSGKSERHGKTIGCHPANLD